jgi:hypothetical protein
MLVAADRHIQELVRNNFDGRTCLTIAHRLNTIIDYHAIVVLEAGRVSALHVLSARSLNTPYQPRGSRVVAATSRSEIARVCVCVRMSLAGRDGFAAGFATRSNVCFLELSAQHRC